MPGHQGSTTGGAERVARPLSRDILRPMAAHRSSYGEQLPAPQTASIIINNYNYARFVGLAIESALAQTRPTEVIVVDDGSTDDSREVITRFGSRIRTVFKTNGGQGSAMNAGFADASGDIVLFLDSDDMLDPHAVDTLIDRWEPCTVLAQFPLHIVDGAGARVGVYPDPPSSLSDGDVRPQLLETGTFGVNVTSGLAFRRETLAGIMPLPADYRNAADGYLVRAIAFKGRVQRLEGPPLGSYRRHGHNDSNVWGPGGLADGFRKKIGYAEKELATTRDFARLHGLQVDTEFGSKNADYTGYLLSLLLTDPTAEPVGGLSRWRLLRQYVTTRWTSAWPLPRRALAVVLVSAAVISPRTISARLLRWLHDPETRPGWARALARHVRRRQSA